MTSLQRTLEEQLMALPKKALEQKIKSKLRAAGEETPPELVAKLTEHILAGARGPFRWEDAGPERKLSLTLTNSEVDEIVEPLNNLLQNKLPNIITDISNTTANAIVNDLKKRWPEQGRYEETKELAFRRRLRVRWEKPLDLLKIIISVAIEVGDTQRKNQRRSRLRKNLYTRAVLTLLHARSCQVTREIVALIEAGYADGAMARWRTLHEISVIAALVADHGEDLAERYLAHEIVDVQRALEEYVRVQVPLGALPPVQREVAKIGRKFKAAIAKYGSGFGKPYGWAARALKLKMYCGTVLRQLAALAQAAKGKAATGVGSIASRDMVCSSLTLAGVLYPCRATSQVSL
jgi:hypothetical protein